MKVNVPVLALNGEKDLQVPSENLEYLKNMIEKKEKYTFIKLPKHNHLFQTAITGHPKEYAQIKEDISEETIQIIINWLSKIK